MPYLLSQGASVYAATYKGPPWFCRLYDKQGVQRAYVYRNHHGIHVVRVPCPMTTYRHMLVLANDPDIHLNTVQWHYYISHPQHNVHRVYCTHCRSSASSLQIISFSISIFIIFIITSTLACKFICKYIIRNVVFVSVVLNIVAFRLHWIEYCFNVQVCYNIFFYFKLK